MKRVAKLKAFYGEPIEVYSNERAEIGIFIDYYEDLNAFVCGRNIKPQKIILSFTNAQAKRLMKGLEKAYAYNQKILGQEGKDI